MYARLVNELPEGNDWLYEVKFDGYRCLAGRDDTGVTLWSRRGKPFHQTIPADQPALARLAVPALYDSELSEAVNLKTTLPQGAFWSSK